jgi:hypothetical protein
MNTTTPRTEKVWKKGGGLQSMDFHARTLERELTAAREELVETRKDFMCLAELLDGHDATECRMNLVRLKEQLDRLAEALEQILEYQGRFAEEDPESIAREALQSLTTNEL